MNCTEFLKARVAELPANNYDKSGTVIKALMTELIELHDQWPVLVTEEPVFDGSALELGGANLNSITFQMTQRMNWVTQEQYRRAFGDDPPTAPMIAKMAEYFSNHPDYNPDWETS